jgi:hypothetical protein
MTAEVAVLNKDAVALAADSAVTIRFADRYGRSREKVYKTDKVFTLSKYAPVGVMVYADATFLGVPWSTIIKMYREHLNDQRFDTLHDYADHFLEFVTTLVNEKDEKNFFVKFLSQILLSIVNEINREVEETTAKSMEGTISKDEVIDIIDKQIHEFYKKSLQKKSIWDEEILKTLDLEGYYSKEIKESINIAFAELPLTEGIRENLRRIAIQVFAKDILWSSEVGPSMASGIVIAGFGESDIYPCLYDFFLQGIVNGRMRIVTKNTAQICNTSSSIIKTFAQHEAVNAFVEGVDPGYQELIRGWLQATFEENYPTLLEETLEAEGLDPELIKRVLKDVRTEGQIMLNTFNEKRTEYSRTRLVDPMLMAVSVLSKDELAEIAESLVNLTSIRRRVSLDAETVGGPIDVAVISKGDGFIWIRRKHYFNPKLNHHFFRNYFNSDQGVIHLQQEES